LLFCPSVSIAKIKKEQKKSNPVVEDLKNLFSYRLARDAKYIFTSPQRVDKSHLIPIIVASGLTVGLMAVDEDVREYARNHHNQEASEFLSIYIAPLGDGRYGVGICSLFYIEGLCFHNEKAKQTGTMGLESMACAGTLSFLGKLFIGRHRPKDNKGAFDYTGPSSKSYKSSFPSGHVTVTFSLASVIAEQYDNIFVNTLVYGAASGVGFQRIYDDEHWLSDVFAGAMLGTLIGKTIVKLNKDDSQLSLKPIIDSEKGTKGIAFNIAF